MVCPSDEDAGSLTGDLRDKLGRLRPRMKRKHRYMQAVALSGGPDTAWSLVSVRKKVFRVPAATSSCLEPVHEQPDAFVRSTVSGGLLRGVTRGDVWGGGEVGVAPVERSSCFAHCRGSAFLLTQRIRGLHRGVLLPPPPPPFPPHIPCLSLEDRRRALCIARVHPCRPPPSWTDRRGLQSSHSMFSYKSSTCEGRAG